MTAEQISELVLDLYAARPEAKAYLDFFVTPDIEKKLDKARCDVSKELMRNSRGRNRTRSTKLRRLIKDISSLNPGTEPVAELMTYTVEMMCVAGLDQWISPTTQSGLARLLRDTIIFIDRSGVLQDYLPRIEKAVYGMEPSSQRGNEFRRLLKNELSDTVESL